MILGGKGVGFGVVSNYVIFVIVIFLLFAGVNECLYDKFCDQFCVDQEDGYQCMCAEGYTHQLPNAPPGTPASKNRCYVKPGINSHKSFI
jgi:hypothetical protein